MRNTFVTRMLISYLPILLFAVGLIVFISIAYLSEVQVRNAEQANRAATGYVMNSVDHLLKNVDTSIVKDIQANPDYLQFLDPSFYGDDPQLAVTVSNRLRTFMVQQDLIESIYLYRLYDDKVLDQSTLQPVADFADRDFVRSSWQNTALYGPWSPPRRINDASGFKTEEPLISIARNIPLDFGSQGMMIVNVKVSAVRSFAESMINAELSTLEILDQTGKPLYEPGHKTDASAGHTYDIRSDYTGWTFRSAIQGGPYAHLLTQGSLVWMLLGIAVVVFAIGMTLYVTKRNYKPIQSILFRIDRFADQLKQEELRKSGSNEFAFIDSAIEKLITKNIEYKEQHQEHLDIQQRQLFHQILLGEADPADCLADWSSFGYQAEAYAVAIVELDGYSSFSGMYSQRDQSLFKFVISSITEELAEEHRCAALVSWINKRQMVFMLRGDHGGELKEQLLRLAEQIRLWVEKHLHFTVTLGLGTDALDLDDISRSYDEALHALSFKITLGGNRVIESAELGRTPRMELFSDLKQVHDLVRQLRTAEPDWRDKLGELFQAMYQGLCQKEEVHRLLSYLMFQLDREMTGAPEQLAAYWERKGKPMLDEAIHDMDALSQCEAAFAEVLEQMYLEMSRLAEQKGQFAVAKAIKEYIAGHYADPDLSLNLLGEVFQLNPKYISQLFKEELGENFSDYLVGLRMEHAKRMLKETDEPIQEIAVKSGYLNPASFNRTFKKFAGSSPTAYRSNVE